MGPLELKLLSISGKKMKLIPQGGGMEGVTEDEDEAAMSLESERWPVTPRMIKQTLRPSLISLDEHGRRKPHSFSNLD